MIHIKSYLLRPDLGPFGPNDLVQYSKKYLIPIEDTEEIIKIKPKIDIDYIKGTIEIIYNEKKVLGIEYWDDINYTWPYILNILEDYYKHGYGETYLPSQGYTLAIKKHSQSCLFFISGEKTFYIHDKNKFIEALLRGAEDFFNMAINVLAQDKSDFDHEFSQIAFIRNHIQNDTD